MTNSIFSNQGFGKTFVKSFKKSCFSSKAGSIVVLDINSGQLLSMVSVPTYDSNLIVKKPKKDVQNPEKVDEEVKQFLNLKKMNYLIQTILLH